MIFIHHSDVYQLMRKEIEVPLLFHREIYYLIEKYDMFLLFII